jgi:hypothetical protein
MNFYSIHFNRPDFISIQKKYLIGGDIFVINNGNNPDIENECKKLNIRYSNCRNIGINSFSHANALNYLAHNIIDYSQPYAIIDHDLFVYRTIEFQNYDIIGLKQTRGIHSYLWPGFIACRSGISLKDINFFPNTEISGDSGCATHKIIKSKEYKIQFLEETFIGEQTTKYPQMSTVMVKIGDIAFHYLNGSFWMNGTKELYQAKNQMIIDLLNQETNKE